MTATDTQDERLGLPSASGMARLLACPGSRNLSRGLSTTITPAGEIGNHGHAVLAGEMDEDDLDDPSEVSIAVERCNQLVEQLRADLGFEHAAEIVEQRWFLHDDAGEPVASGRMDRAYVLPGKAFIPDFKLGHKDQIPPALNPQLILYALLLWEEYGVTEFYLAIIPAWRKVPPVAHVTVEALMQWRDAILAAIALSERDDAPRRAGPHCDYCPARPICREAWAIVHQASTFSAMDTAYGTELERFEMAKHAQATITTFIADLKQRVANDPESVPGLRLKPGKRVEILRGSGAVYERLKGHFSLDDLLSTARLSVTGLASLSIGGPPKVKQLNKDGKAAKAALIETLGELITITNAEPSLERC